MNKIKQKTLSVITSIILGSISFISFIPQTYAISVPIFSITTNNVDYEEGTQFTAVIHLDTDGSSIKETDLYIKYDPQVLEVVDQKSRSGIQISEENDLGSYQLNEVNINTGEIHVNIAGVPQNSHDIILANIKFNTIGSSHTTVGIEPVTSKIYTEDDSPLGFKTTDLVITRIDKDYRGIKIFHAQSTYLAEENKPITLDMSIDTEDEILQAEIYYREWKDNNQFYTDDWLTENLIESSEEGRYYVTIPAENVKIPGITYYFKVRTTQSFTTLPRPVTIEEAYKIKVLTAEEFNDKTPPQLSFNPPKATFTNEQYVAVLPDEPEVTIFCTIDGSDPTTSSYIYYQPIYLTETTTVKCFGIDKVGNIGDAVIGEYTKENINLLSASISASPTQIIRGQDSILSWGTNGAAQVTITPEIGTVSMNGSLSVRPMMTTTYTLMATSGQKTIQKNATIYVSETQVMPTPVEPPDTGPKEVFLALFALSGSFILFMRKDLIQ